jgi:hypothetical protein
MILGIVTTINSRSNTKKETQSHTLFHFNEIIMASSKAPWEMKPEEVEKQMAGQTEYEDCLACRITGRTPQTITR